MNADAQKTILIIDDEEDFARTLSSRLELRGLTAPCAFSGEEGLACIRESAPDLVLLDMRMPGISGVEVLRRLRGGKVIPESACLPVFIVSGHASEENFTEVESLGIQGRFAKPLDFTELFEAMLRLFSSKKGGT